MIYPSEHEYMSSLGFQVELPLCVPYIFLGQVSTFWPRCFTSSQKPGLGSAECWRWPDLKSKETNLRFRRTKWRCPKSLGYHGVPLIHPFFFGFFIRNLHFGVPRRYPAWKSPNPPDFSGAVAPVVSQRFCVRVVSWPDPTTSHVARMRTVPLGKPSWMVDGLICRWSIVISCSLFYRSKASRLAKRCQVGEIIWYSHGDRHQLLNFASG